MSLLIRILLRLHWLVRLKIRKRHRRLGHSVVITIDGVEYNPEDLSDEIKYMVAQVKDIDDKLGHLRFQVDQLSAAKIAFSDAIVKGVTDASQE
jgi:hypothetical protein